uniref:Envelopment polyprotein n=1 Tax=Toros virus TaxID=1764085 RepID=A0A159D7V5_9VIRU|nr:glycoprotein precursor complex [Toros virus]
MIEIFLIVLVVASAMLLALADVRLDSISSGKEESICFSQNTKVLWIESYWGYEMAKMPGFDLYCRYNDDGDYKFMTNEKARQQIPLVSGAPDSMRFSCGDKNGEFSVTLTNDGRNNMMEGALIKCGTKEFIKSLPDSVSVPTTEASVSIVNGTWEKELEKAENARKQGARLHEEVKASLEGKLSALKHELEKKENDLERTKSELESVRMSIGRKMEAEDKLQDAQYIIEQLREKVASLTSRVANSETDREDLLRAKNEMKELRRQVKSMEDETNEIRRAFMQRPETTKSPPLIATTMLALLSTATIAGGTEPGQRFNSDPHINNRPGLGSFKLFDNDSDATCSRINYGLVCAKFDYLKSLTRYPFFNSHFHHRPILEAYHDSIITKSDKTFCDSAKFSSKDPKCVKEIRRMAYKCPRGVPSIHYIDSEGKIGSLTCPTDEELMDNCMHCRKALKKPVTKFSMQLQDVVCQPDSSEYSGPMENLKGYCRIGMKQFKSCEKSMEKEEVVPFIVIKNKGKLYLSTLRLRNREEMENDNFMCYEAKPNAGSDTNTNHGGKQALNIKECKVVDSQKTKICTGDGTFCSKYACDNEIPDAHCEVAPGSGPLEVMYGGVWIKPMCVGFEKAIVRRELPPDVNTNEVECDSCYSECREDGILVRSTGFMISAAVACSHGSCVSTHNDASTEILIPYPGMSASVGGDIGIHLSHDDVQVSSHYKVHCEPRDPCVMHSCLICAEGLINYQCHTALSAFVVCTVLVSASMIIILILKKILRCLRIAPAVLLTPALWIIRLAGWMGRSIRRKTGEKIEKLNKEMGWQANTELPARPTGVNRERRPIPRSAVYMALILVISPAFGCSDNIIASSKIVKCVNRDSKDVCTVSGVVNVKAGPIGSETCVVVRGPTDSDKKFLTIKTVASELTCVKGQSYWTSQYGVTCLSSRRCHLVAECKKDNCLAWNDTMISAEFAGMTNNTVTSENKCFEQCGGIGCGCFNVYPSCLFVHSQLKATKREAIEVFSCVDWNHRLILEVSDFQGNKEKVIMSGMTTKFTGWGSLTLALDFDAITGTNSLSFLRSSSGAFSLVDEALSTEPRAGYIGEVRCSSEAAALSAHKSCKVAPGIIHYKPMTDIIECSTSLMDPFAIFLRGALPQTRNGKTFTSSIDKKTVQALTSGVVKASMTLNFDNHDIEFEVSKTTCFASFINATGCYSCNEGARICIQTAAVKNTTLYVHNPDNSLVLIMEVVAPQSTSCRTIHVSKPQLKEDVVYTCDGTERAMTITGTLIALNPFDDRKTEASKSIVVNPKSGDWSLWSWSSGLMNWLGGPLRTAGIIVGYILLAIALVLIFAAVVPRISSIVMATIIKKKK